MTKKIKYIIFMPIFIIILFTMTSCRKKDIYKKYILDVYYEGTNEIDYKTKFDYYNIIFYEDNMVCMSYKYVDTDDYKGTKTKLYGIYNYNEGYDYINITIDNNLIQLDYSKKANQITYRMNNYTILIFKEKK